MIEFRLDPRSGVSTYMQLVHQVRQALRIGLLKPGDQLPTAKDVVGHLAINPNTVLKAYRELEHAGLVATRPGQGTFVMRDLPGPRVEDLQSLRRRLQKWLEEASGAGLDDEAVDALIAASRRDIAMENIA
jgi:GntR family transcriptional regulator